MSLFSKSSLSTMRVLLIALPLASLAAVPIACTVTSSDGTTSTTGSILVHWTVASTTDAAQCAAYGAASIVLELTDSSGSTYGTSTTASCSSFSASLPNLPPGTYGLRGHLINGSGQTITTLVGPVSVSIQSGLATTASLDFPANSFTAPAATTPGTLAVNWTIALAATPALCTSHNAANIVIELSDVNGAAYGTATSVPCSAFTSSIANIAPGTYQLKAHLVNASGQSVTSTVGPVAVVIAGGGTLTQPIDFPETAFTITPTAVGSIVVNWTIASVNDAAQCTANSAASIVVELTDSSGSAYGSPVTVACSAFTTTIGNVPPGIYGVRAHMVNASSVTNSSVVGPVQVTVPAAGSITQALDFPTTSFSQPQTANTGTVNLSWSLSGLKDAAQCTAHNVANISVQLNDNTGAAYGAARLFPCASFASSVASVPAGNYTVTATLVNASSVAATTTIGPVALTVTAAGTIAQAFDFPANSFL